MGLDEIDKEFNAFLDQQPIYDPVQIAFDHQIVREFAFQESERYHKQLVQHFGEDNYVLACEKRDEFQYWLTDRYAGQFSPEALTYRKDVQEARDNARKGPLTENIFANAFRKLGLFQHRR